MSQLKTKYIADNAVTGAKFKLDNDQSLRARNAANSADVNLLKLNSSDVLIFQTHPRSSASASNADDVVTKKDMDAYLEGLKPKEAVRVATTANITLSGAQTIDGVSAVAGNRVLVWKQTTASQNGIYVVAAGAWSRSSDFDSLTPIDEINGASVSVQEGTLYAGWNLVQYGTVATLGTDPVNFTYRSNFEITGGDGISVTGNDIDVDHDGQGLTFSGGQLALELDGSTLSKSGSGLKVATDGITENEIASSVDAESFVIAAGYTPTSGNVTVGDTIQAAIQKVEYKIDNAAATTPSQQTFTLTGTNITNGYVDLSQIALAGSVHLIPFDGVPQIEGVDFTLSTPGAFTRVTFAGDLATGGDAALVASDVIYIKYMY